MRIRLKKYIAITLITTGFLTVFNLKALAQDLLQSQETSLFLLNETTLVIILFLFVIISSLLTLLAGFITAKRLFNSYLIHKKEERFIQLTGRAGSNNPLISINAILSFPIFAKQASFPTEDKFIGNFLDEYYSKNPFVKETINIIMYTLISESQKHKDTETRTTTIIEKACRDAISDINRITIYESQKHGLLRSILSLKNIDLSGVYLERADLSYATLTSSTLEFANLKAAKLYRAYFENADLSNTILAKANLNESTLKNAQISFSDLHEATLINADLTKANLASAKLVKADLNTAKLVEADFTNADLSRANLTKVDLTNADLTKAVFTNTNLSEATLTMARFLAASLLSANLTNCQMMMADLAKAKLVSADLTGTNLSNADLIDADLSNADLTKTDLGNADLSNAILTMAYLVEADLTRALLNKARLWEANLMNAILDKTELSNADLKGAIIFNAKGFAQSVDESAILDFVILDKATYQALKETIQHKYLWVELKDYMENTLSIPTHVYDKFDKSNGEYKELLDNPEAGILVKQNEKVEDND